MELAMGAHTGGHDAMDQAMGQHHADGHDHAGGHVHASETGSGQPGDEHAASEACNACSAYCSLTPLLSNVPTLVEPLDPTAVKFNALSAPPPSFVSDGQERPPRTI
jgi:hypothetical protein